MTREVRLLAFGNTRSAGPWRHPDIDNSAAGVRRRLISHAQTAEAGALDGLFFADGLNFGPPAKWAYKTTEDFEPLTTTAALSSVTERIGLVVTGSATPQHPYHLARQLLSLDHLSGGLAGWNPVTNFARAAADNFSARGVVDHDERFRVAEEAIDGVKKLWDSWGEGTIVEDRVVDREHPLATREPIGFHELSDQPFVALDRDHTLRKIFDDACARRGITATIAYQGSDIMTLRGLIGARLGVTILPRASTPSPDIVEIIVDDNELVRPIAVGWMANRYLPPSAASFRDGVLAWYRNENRATAHSKTSGPG